jgi:hypothetical protein
LSADLRLAPCTVKDAKRWVARHHSRLRVLVGALMAVAVEQDNRRVCVATVSLPKAKAFNGRKIAEVSRVASDGTAEHAASMAYGAARRLALAAGYRRVVSYTHQDEPGICLKAAGFWPVAITRGGEWGRDDRPRQMALDAREKIRWEAGPEAQPLNRKVAETIPGWGRRTA